MALRERPDVCLVDEALRGGALAAAAVVAEMTVRRHDLQPWRPGRGRSQGGDRSADRSFTRVNKVGTAGPLSGCLQTASFGSCDRS
jgi:hypothetical protein